MNLYQNCLKHSVPMNKMAARENKTFKKLLSVNQWMDLDIVSQGCSLDDPLWKFVQTVLLLKQDGHQS